MALEGWGALEVAVFSDEQSKFWTCLYLLEIFEKRRSGKARRSGSEDFGTGAQNGWQKDRRRLSFSIFFFLDPLPLLQSLEAWRLYHWMV